MFPAGPQPRVPLGIVPCNRELRLAVFPCRTSTANSAWQCFSPDLNRKCQITVGSTGPQHTATQHDHKHTIHNHNHKQKPQAQSQTHNHKHTYTNTQPHTHKAIHTMTNTHSQTQLQTLSHKHNYKHITTSTTTNTIRKKTHNRLETLAAPRREPEDPQAKSQTTKPTSIATCSSPCMKANNGSVMVGITRSKVSF